LLRPGLGRGRPGGSLAPFIRYCIVGGINTVTDLAIFILLTGSLKIAPAPANLVSYTTALCLSFVLNRNFTFRAARYSLMPAAQFYRFVAVNLISLVGSTAAVWSLSTLIVPIAAKLATTPLVTAWGFVAVRLIVFRRAKREVSGVPDDAP
jgi:putative flippase GtrA